MHAKGLATCLLLQGAACLFLLVPDLTSALDVWSRLERFEVKRFVVTDARCVGGERVRSQGQWHSEPTRCHYTGTIDGREEVLETGSSLPGDHAPGSSFEVWFDPEHYGTGLGGESLRIRWYEENMEARVRRRALGSGAALVMALLAVPLLNAVYWLRVPGRRRDSPSAATVVDTGGGLPYLGIPFSALGSALAIEPLLAWAPPGGRWIAGLALLAVGPPLLARRSAHLEGGRLTAAWSWLGLTESRHEVETGAGDRLRVGADAEARSYELRIEGADAARALGSFAGHGAARAAGERIGAALGLRLEVDPPLAARPPSLGTRIAGLVLLAAAGAVLVPGVREAVYRAWLAPASSAPPPLQSFAAARLAGHPSDSSVETLVRVVNTRFEESPVLVAAALASLREIAGLEPLSPDDWWRATEWLNPWAAERLRRSLDAHGGVLSWYPVGEALQAELETLASADPETGSGAWSAFAAGVVSSPEEFLEQLGAALGDPRPIAFAIVRTPDAEAAFEASAEPIPASGEVLARTVGEALALKYWTYLAGRSERLRQRTDADAGEQLARVDTGAFPADFRSWWADYARIHRLPPQPR